MRMLKDKVPFIVTDDISQLVMPRTAIKNAVTIRLGDNEVISGLATREIDDDVFGQDDVDSKEDEFMSNDGHDEFLNREEELMDDEQDQESLEEEDDTEFVDEELEQMREPEMKRGQIGGSLNGNRGKNGHKNAHSRVQDAFGGNGNNNEDVYDEIDDGSERDGGALSYQHHNKAPERKAISRDFEDDLDYQDTFKSRSHGRINGEKRKGSKRAKKSTLGDNRRGKMGSMKRDGLPF